MKRTLSIISVVLLLATSTLLLVACGGGIKTEQQWNDAMNYVKNCDALTITIEEKWATRVSDLIFKETLKTQKVIEYDGKQGILYYRYEMRRYDVLGIEKGIFIEESYYCVEDNGIQFYAKGTAHIGNSWDIGWRKDYDDQDAALVALKEQCLALTVSENVEGLKYVDVDNLKYDDFSAKFLSGKFESKPVTDKYEITHQLTFSGGKLTKLSYETESRDHAKADDKTETTTTIKYTVDVTLPDGLRDAGDN